jgi:hypothetical protein
MQQTRDRLFEPNKLDIASKVLGSCVVVDQRRSWVSGLEKTKQPSSDHDLKPRRRSWLIFLPLALPFSGGWLIPRPNTGQHATPHQLPEAEIPQWHRHGPTIMREIHHRATLLVTAVDELFGTHRWNGLGGHGVECVSRDVQRAGGRSIWAGHVNGVVLVAVLQAQGGSVRAADSVAIMPTSCITASGPHALVLAAVLDSCWQVRRTSWRAEAEAVFFARPSVVYAVRGRRAEPQRGPKLWSDAPGQ